MLRPEPVEPPTEQAAESADRLEKPDVVLLKGVGQQLALFPRRPEWHLIEKSRDGEA